MTRKSGFNNHLTLAGLVLATVTVAGSAAMAGHDLTFRGPGTWRKVWTGKNTCYADNASTGNKCVPLGNKNFCGVSMFVSPNTREVAEKKWSYGETVSVRSVSTNDVVCNISP